MALLSDTQEVGSLPFLLLPTLLDTTKFKYNKNHLENFPRGETLYFSDVWVSITRRARHKCYRHEHTLSDASPWGIILKRHLITLVSTHKFSL